MVLSRLILNRKRKESQKNSEVTHLYTDLAELIERERECAKNFEDQ